jgi:hypothetical protein
MLPFESTATPSGEASGEKSKLPATVEVTPKEISRMRLLPRSEMVVGVDRDRGRTAQVVDAAGRQCENVAGR